MAIQDWPAAFKAAGVPYQLHNGFPNTPKPQGSLPSKLSSLYVHHDATPMGPTPGGLDWLIGAYNAGSPSAQIWMDYYGIWHFCGAGVASHAGVVRGPLTNQNSAGLETDHTTGEGYTTVQMANLLRGCAAACRAEGRGADFITFHKIEARPIGRKQDPWFSPASNTQANWDKELADFRSKVQAIINGGSPSQPDQVPEEEEESFMAALTDDQQRDLYNKINYLYTQDHIEGTGYGRIAAGFNILTDISKKIDQLVSELGVLYTNEQFDPPLGYTKTAANFNDVRGLIVQMNEVLALLKGSTPDPGTKTYTVVAGDTFISIAKKLGVTVDALKAANPQVSDISNIAVGQVLNVPKA